MEARNTGSSGGLGLASTIGVVFIILKLLKIIEWSWLWVLAPFWIGFALYIVFVALFLFFWSKF